MNSKEDVSDVEDNATLHDELPEDIDSDDTDAEEDKEHFSVDSSAVIHRNEPSVTDEAADAVTQGINEENRENDKKKEEMNEGESHTKSTKKRGRKLKKVSEKRTAFDGRKVVFVTECTQTDWNWKDKTEKSGRGVLVSPTAEKRLSISSRNTDTKSNLVKPDSRQNFGQALSDGDSRQEVRTVTDLTPFSFVPDDEFGLPVLDISSDSDSSEGEAEQSQEHYKHHLPSVGPPQILRYIKESERLEKQTEKGSRNLEQEAESLKLTDNLSDEQVITGGMFSGPCEFCGLEIKPFPSLDQQLSESPETLYCCEGYRDFVEFAIMTATKLEEDIAKKSEQININVHAHHGSKRDRLLAKEMAVQRMREREHQRRLQEVMEMQATYHHYSPVQKMSVRSDEEEVDQTDDSQGHLGGFEIGAGKEAAKISTGKDANKISTGKETNAEIKTAASEDDNDKVANLESKRNAEKAAVRSKGKGGKSGGNSASGMGDNYEEKRTLARREGGGGGQKPVTQHFSLSMTQGPGAKYPYGSLNIEVARQMKTINYQLSSQRCLEEGWTLRAPSPMENDDLESEVFISEPLSPAVIAMGKLHDGHVIEKYYPDKSKFLTIFPDGTGNIFYPSGKIAMVISSITLGQNTYIVLDDNDHGLLGLFEPNGYGCCNFVNGKIRLTYDPTGGLELDHAGSRRKVWNWKDHETHNHAPPFQPIVFGMNSYLGVRFIGQESIALTFTGRKRSCRFNVGSKLKPATSSDNTLTKSVDESQLLISEHKIKVETILNKIANLLKFPKSPKLDRILPPLSVSVRQQKLDKMKQESASSAQNQQTNPKSRKLVKHTKLPPLNSPVVPVS